MTGSEHNGRAVRLADSQRRRRARARRQRSARVRRLVDSLGRALGLPRRVVVDGVVYRERSSLPLRRALTPTGGGVKEYDVRFPAADGRTRARMRIRVTPTRLYADLGFSRRLGLYRSCLDGRVRPGDRVLELGCGTGAGSAFIAEQVGPSGGVVALERDGESIRYARQRYLAANLGFELGGADSLSGELDGAFDVVVAVDPLSIEPEAAAALQELWRVTAPGGVLMICQHPDARWRSVSPCRDPLAERVAALLASGRDRPRVRSVDGPSDTDAVVVVCKPADPDRNPDAGGPGPASGVGSGDE